MTIAKLFGKYAVISVTALARARVNAWRLPGLVSWMIKAAGRTRSICSWVFMSSKHECNTGDDCEIRELAQAVPDP
jgi:hypothetical protein